MSATLAPQLCDLLTRLEDATEFREGCVGRPADPMKWLSTYLHKESYSAENAKLTAEVETLRDEAARLALLDDARRAALGPAPAPADEGDDAS